MRLLAAVIVLSLVARVAFIDQPCRVPCRSVADHAPIFDETYYVGAAHVIAGRAPLRGEQYGGAARGMDPNSEHPQLGKLVIAASIEALGDGPLAWRLGSILAGTLAILGMFALVRAAGGSEGEAAVAAALMAADNLMIVHGRIGTLDAPVLAAMVWSVALYLRGRPVVAGVLLGIGACFKLVAPYALLGLLAFELLALVRGGSARWWARGRPAMGRLGTIGAAGTATMLALLQALDWLAPPYDPGSRQRVGGGVLGHLAHMVSYAAHEVSPHGPRGIASYPWEWLVDFKPIVYLSVDPAEPARGLAGLHPAVHFLGAISPPILVLGLPALVWLGWRWLREPRGGRACEADPSAGRWRLDALALAWLAGTFLPFVGLSLLFQRTSYLYYMVVVMPAVYIAAARAAVRLGSRHRRALSVWAVSVVLAAVLLYPFTPLP